MNAENFSIIKEDCRWDGDSLFIRVKDKNEHRLDLEFSRDLVEEMIDHMKNDRHDEDSFFYKVLAECKDFIKGGKND